jgi:hypothetical protein
VGQGPYFSSHSTRCTQARAADLPYTLLIVRRRFWIAVGMSALAHLAFSLAVLFLRAPAPAALAPPVIELELLASAEPEAPPVATPAEEPLAPAPRPPRAKRPDRPRAQPPTESGQPLADRAQPGSPASPAPSAQSSLNSPGSKDPLATFRPRNQPLALGPKPPALPPGPRPGSFEALFNQAPDVLHHKTSESAIGVKREGNGLEARVTPDGRIAFNDPPAVKYTGLGLRFDVSEMAMRAMGDDPHAAQKARIADATREERFCLTLKDAESDKRNALYRLKDNLEQIVADPTLSGAERRAAVFDLWEGCLDASDDVLANAARATIVAFIRRSFPAGSRSAYTPVELAMLNRRRNCSRPFDPYATRTTDRRPNAGAH